MRKRNTFSEFVTVESEKTSKTLSRLRKLYHINHSVK